MGPLLVRSCLRWWIQDPCGGCRFRPAPPSALLLGQEAAGQRSLRSSCPHSVFFCLFPGKPRVELTFDKTYTVTSRLTFTVGREDDGVPVVCIVDHPAVKDFQAQKLLEVQCE